MTLLFSDVQMRLFKAIAAMSENRVIGKGNRIPWHLPEDFKWFKKLTTGNIVVMGRKTFESIGRPLPNRETIILSRRGLVYPGIKTIGNLKELGPDSREIFICGGAEVYREALLMCSDVYLTLVKGNFAGDTFFPPFEHLFAPPELILERPEFTIFHYRIPQSKG